MTEAHGWVAIAVVGVTVLLSAVAGWSWIAGRRSGGAADHRFAVDRALLLAEAAIALNVVLGVALLAVGQRPADPLHLLYGVAALVTVPLGWWWGGRGAGRARRDAWIALAGLVLLGVEARLFLTG